MSHQSDSIYNQSSLSFSKIDAQEAVSPQLFREDSAEKTDYLLNCYDVWSATDLETRGCLV
ncbi:hypothetical protein ACTL6U_01195 [Rhodovibrionaceae bacterium A322]